MKKVIAILAIMVVLVSVVFASETHTIKLKTQVQGDDPIFALAAYKGDDVTASPDVLTNETAAYEDGARNEKTLSVADISKNNITVIFVSKLVNEAKSTDKFTVEFVPGPFVVKKLNNNNERETAYVYAATTGENASTGVAGTGDRDGYALSAVSSSTVGDQISFKSTIQFNSAKSTPGAIATYTVTYLKDEDVASNTADEPSYYADCKLTITVNN